MKQRRAIYIASPLGFSEVGRFFMIEKLFPALVDAGYDIIDPWALTSDDDLLEVNTSINAEARKNAWRKLNPIIGKRNKEGIDRSDGLIAVLDGVDVDSGTASEIGYASALKKPIIGYRGDFRLSADNEGSIVNLQVEYFIRSSGGDIVTSMDELIQRIKMIIV